MIFFQFIQFSLADTLTIGRIIRDEELDQKAHDDARDEK